MSTEENTPQSDSKIALTVEIDKTEFFNQAVEHAVEKLLKDRSYDEDGEEHRYPNAFQREVREMVMEAIKGSVLGQVETLVRDTLAKPLPKVDTYGDIDRSGATQTLAEKIGEEVRVQVVDRAKNYNNSSRHGNESVLHKVIRETVETVVTGELKAEVEQARAKVRERVKGKVAELLEAETLRSAGLK
jgi:trans-2-enoyl-CoA reductase